MIARVINSSINVRGRCIESADPALNERRATLIRCLIDLHRDHVPTHYVARIRQHPDLLPIDSARAIPHGSGTDKALERERRGVSAFITGDGVFRLAFRSRGTAVEPEPVEGPPEIDFVAYAADCVLSGRVRLAADRLSDLVNEHDQVELIDVLATDLEGGVPIEVHELVIARSEILVLHATGPRGRADRRSRTRQVPIVATLGPYEVSGYLHVRPGSDALTSLQRARPIVALSDATVEYEVGGQERHNWVGTALINWALASSIVEIVDRPEQETAETPKLVVLTDVSARKAKAKAAAAEAAAATETKTDRSGVAGAA